MISSEPKQSKIPLLALLVALVLQIFFTNVNSATLPSFGSTTFGFDDYSNRYTIDLNLNMDETGNRFSFMLSQSTDISETADQSNQNLDSKSYSLGFGSTPGAPVEFSANYEDWGKSNTFSVDSLSGTVRFNTSDWSFGITPYLRYMDIEGRNRGGQEKNINVDSQGLLLDLSFSGFTRFFIYGRYINYRYSEDVSKLDTSRRSGLLSFFTPATLSFAQGLEDSALSLAVDYSFNPMTLGVELSQSRSAVDDSVANTTTFSLIWPISSQWDAATEGGWLSQEDTDDIQFFSGSIHYRW